MDGEAAVPPGAVTKLACDDHVMQRMALALRRGRDFAGRPVHARQPPFPGGTHTPLPLPGRGLAVVADEANAEKCAKGLFQIFVVDVRVPENPVTISTMPVPHDRDYCVAPGTLGPHNLHENRPGSFQSEETIFATYNAGGVRVFDLKDQFAPKELAFWLPPAPAKLIDPRPNVALAAKTADVYVTRDGVIYTSDWNAGLHVLEYEG